MHGKMKTIVTPVNLLADKEYERASEVYGDRFASLSEGFGVIAEEVQEAGEELDKIHAMLCQLLKAIRQSVGKSVVDLADCISDAAVNGAAELIQVAAMCKKITRTVKEDPHVAV